MLISKFDNTNIESHIKEFEEKYNFKFPKQYRDFLLKYNGGETPKSRFKIGKIDSDIRAFYGLGGVDYYDYSFFVEGMNTLVDYLEDGFVPIAPNVFGDYILIGIKDKNHGEVYFYYHDMPKKYIKLTEDFITFVGKCKSEKIGHVKTIEERKQTMIDNGYGHMLNDDFIRDWQEQIDLYSNMHQEKLILKETDLER